MNPGLLPPVDIIRKTSQKMYPTSIYAEMTPNPNTMKFVADRVIFPTDDPVEYKTMQEAKGHSQLAVELFAFPFVQGVFIDNNYVTVTKSGEVDWDFITFELREFIRQFLLKNEKAAETPSHLKPARTPEAAAPAKPRIPVEPSEYDDAIVQILEEYVRPAVATDGGAIDYVSFKDGVVTVLLRGSCSGCPSSTRTLKDGIERILSAELPMVTKVVAENA